MIANIGDILKCKKAYSYTIKGDRHYCRKGDLFLVDEFDEYDGTFKMINDKRTGDSRIMWFYYDETNQYYQTIKLLKCLFDHFETKLDRAKRIIKKYGNR